MQSCARGKNVNTYEKSFESWDGALKKSKYASSHSLCGSGSQLADRSSRFVDSTG